MAFSWKSNTQGYNANQFLADGGLYHGVLTMRRSGASTDFSGGALTQIAQTDNNNIYTRNSGPNFVGSLTITNAGAGYKNGTYENILLGGGEGYGLKADIVVSGGSISTITLKDSGYGYNETGNSSSTFIVDLPYEHFGTQNTRQITTPAVITATLAQLGSGSSTGNVWSTWRKLWHDGNHGKGSGLNADLLCNYNGRWHGSSLNVNEETFSNSRLPSQLDSKSFNSSIAITVPDPTFQANNGGHYDLYLEGLNLTQEVVNLIDTQAGVAGLQWNLYTANNVNEGTVRIISRKINLDPANYLTGLQYVESNTEWVANGTADRNDRIVYGHNIYKVTNSITGSYSIGTTPPTHISGTVTAPGGNADLEFERKVENPWTILTVELISGNLTSSIKKIGTATAPAEYYDLTDFGIAKETTYSRTKAVLGSDNSGNPYLELGNKAESTTAYIDANTSGNTVVDYDARIEFTGGSNSDGTGTINLRANNAQVNANNIWHAGNITFDSANTASTGVIRDASGNFSAGTITASLTGIASGNLPLTGGTLSGALRQEITSATTWSSSWSGQASYQELGNELALRNNQSGTTGSFTGIFFKGGDSSPNQLIGAARMAATWDGNYAASLRFSTRGGNGFTNMYERLTIKYNGNIGIGVSDPLQTLSVASSDRASSVRISDGSTSSNNNEIKLGYYTASDTDITNLIDGSTFGSIITGGANGHIIMGIRDNDSADSVSILSGWNGSTHYMNASNNVGYRKIVARFENKGICSINGDTDDNYNLIVRGSFAAESKSFVIDHPTKEGHKLRYGSLEGPEHAVYIRGRVTNGVIKLPDYWTELVDINTITVQLTAIGNMSRTVWVKDLRDNKVITGGGDAFYFIQAERKDVEKIIVEYEG